MPQHLQRCDEPGHVHFLTISCYRRLPFFGTPQARDIVVESMRTARDRMGFRWIGYVVMPEHVHWLCYPQTLDERVIAISSVLLSLKTSIGMRVKDYWRAVWAERRTLGSPLLDRWATANKPDKPIWTTRGIDFNVTTEDRLMNKLEYCHNNPVKRQLVKDDAEWPWSSHGFYAQADDILLNMDWDGRWPLT